MLYCIFLVIFTFDKGVHRHLVAVLGRMELHVDVGERARRTQFVPDSRHVLTQRRSVLVALRSELF